jgi:predicted HTH domain antitoxin
MRRPSAPQTRFEPIGGDGATEATERITEPFDHTAVEWDRRLPMSQITFSIPDEILLALKATPEILAARIRIAAAVKLYEMGQLSSGAASQLAGVPKPYFLGHLADYGVNTFDLSEEELIHDLKSA